MLGEEGSQLKSVIMVLLLEQKASQFIRSGASTVSISARHQIILWALCGLRVRTGRQRQQQ